MEVRVDHQVAVVGGEARHRHPVRGHPQRPAVGLDDALRAARGARREQDVRRVVGPQRRRAPPDLGARLLGGPGQELVPALAPAGPRAAGQDDGAEVRELVRQGLGDGCVVGAEEGRDGDEQAGAAARQDLADLGRLEPRVDRDEHGAGLEGAESGDDPLGAVEGPDGDAVAGIRARRDEGRCEGVGLGGQLPVGAAGGSVDDGELVAEPGDGAGDHGRDARPGPVAGAHRRTASSTFISRARLPPMILRMVSSGRPASSST